MAGLLIRTIITALGLAIATWLLPGVFIEGSGTLVLAALLLGLVNAVVRPLLVLLTLPLTVLSLGLFILVINAAMFGLVASWLDAFTVTGFGSAFLGALIVSVTGVLASLFVGPRGRFEVVVIDRRR